MCQPNGASMVLSVLALGAGSLAAAFERVTQPARHRSVRLNYGYRRGGWRRWPDWRRRHHHHVGLIRFPKTDFQGNDVRRRQGGVPGPRAGSLLAFPWRGYLPDTCIWSLYTPSSRLTIHGGIPGRPGDLERALATRDTHLHRRSREIRGHAAAAAARPLIATSELRQSAGPESVRRVRGMLLWFRPDTMRCATCQARLPAPLGREAW